MRKSVQISLEAHRLACKLAAEQRPVFNIGQLVERLIFQEAERGDSRTDDEDVRPVRTVPPEGVSQPG
jgi:hypothetical protein